MLSTWDPQHNMPRMPSAATLTHTGLSALVPSQHPGRDDSTRDRERIAARHTQPHPLTGEVASNVAIGPDRAGLDVAVRRFWAADDMTMKSGDLARMPTRIH
jgi:hypothetical protein